MMFLDEQNDTVSHNHHVAILNNTLNCGLMLIMIKY